MKKYFMIGLAVIFALTVGLIVYGAYLNRQGELQIMHRMEERALPVHGARAAFREIRPHILLNTVNLRATDMADAVTLIDGRIMEVYVDKNSVVSQGQPLFTVVNEKLPMQLKEAESNITKAMAQLKQSANNYDRFRRLVENKAASQAKFEEAEAQYVAAQANLAEAQSRRDQLMMQEARQTVTAPVAGKVLFIYRQAGSYVQPGTALALVGNFSSLYFDFPIDDYLLGDIDVGYIANLRFKNGVSYQKAYSTSFESGNQGAEGSFRAVVTEISPPPSEPAAYRNLRWQVDNGAGMLEPQTYDSVNIEADAGRRALAVPLDALIDSHENEVFVVTAENKLERRQIKAGADDDAYVEILSGLAEGEIVVVSGKEGLEEGLNVKVALDE